MSEATTGAVGAVPAAGRGTWISELGTKEKRALGACVGGWALDAMDVQLYSFVIPTLIATWGVTRAEAGALGTAALLTSAIGGWLAGFLADRWGRVHTLQIAILWFAGFTFLSGLAQSFEQLFAARALMGLGFGGEWAAGAVLLGETIRPEHRGKALGTMQSGWALGWGAAALLYTLFFSLMPPETAWRALFFVGIAPALLVFVLRRYVEEPDVYRESQAKIAETGDKPSFFEIFRPPLLRITVLGALMGTGAQGGYFAVTTWLPTFLRTERGLSVLNSGGYLAVLIVGSFCGYLSGAYLADRIGRRATFLVFAIGAGVIVTTYTMVPFGNAAMLVLGFPLGFFASGVFSAMGAFFTEQFPTRVRGVGQGFAYNFGRAIGAIFPTLVGLLSASMPLGQAIGLFAAAAYATMAVAAFLLPETKGKALTA
ncbi:major facilitator superfamily MFS_1 [Methylobacterium sp. 4-46]|uniref:MFS transporter n=1 Tax=unclassified Methylobacterium TaxID=2615210 RepID=UPI000165CAAE|nr:MULTISPECIES: MFS transporter [Methylobacterium]ACA16427.1 major facilitator superfamily MFS_1 [Methylobacterium sp. 4-46]WFT82138.1 MFS transporter [Methylobacterium nodulans]